MTKASAFIDTSKLSNKSLQDFDQMMIEATIKLDLFTSLASAVWGEVQEELSKRGLVRLISGSFDDVGNNLVQRDYQLPK